MLRTLLPPAAGWLVILGAALVSLAGSLNYLGGSVYALIGTAASAKAPGGPDFVASVEPLPSGSVSAVVPLPLQTHSVPANMVAGDPLAAAPAPDETAAQELIASAAPVSALDTVSVTQSRMVATISVNVRDRPSNDSSVIGTLQGGGAVAVLGTHQGWMQIADGSGLSGWVYGRYLRPVN